MPNIMPNDTNMASNNSPIDLTKFIRSIQRLEGNPDCFKKAQGYCSQSDCAWRQYCLDDNREGVGTMNNSILLESDAVISGDKASKGKKNTI